MCAFRESDNIFECILCNRRTVERYCSGQISNSPIDHHTVFSTLHLDRLKKDYESDVSTSARCNHSIKRNQINAVESLLGFWLVIVISSTPNRSGRLHSDIAFHLPLWQIVFLSWQIRLHPQQAGFLEQYCWQVSRASLSPNRKSLGKSNFSIVFLLMFWQVIPPSFCWNSLGNTIMETFVLWFCR